MPSVCWDAVVEIEVLQRRPCFSFSPWQIIQKCGVSFLATQWTGCEQNNKSGISKYIPRDVISLSLVAGVEAVAKLLVAAEIEIKLDCYNAAAPAQRNKLYTASIK